MIEVHKTMADVRISYIHTIALIFIYNGHMNKGRFYSNFVSREYQTSHMETAHETLKIDLLTEESLPSVIPHAGH